MVKSSRKSTAAALSTAETRREIEDSTSDPIAGPPTQDVGDGFVVLNSRRPSRAQRPEAETANDVGEQIGEQLRGLYDDILNQPIPDRFLELLNRLESDPISPTRSKTPGEG
ncbi:hypothetical protein IY145_09370 [Methylosinus sp. H3A]|nr:hypothetical protein [Methylosinus sp. H3A]